MQPHGNPYDVPARRMIWTLDIGDERHRIVRNGEQSRKRPRLTVDCNANRRRESCCVEVLYSNG
jgi:hypothetical protein